MLLSVVLFLRVNAEVSVVREHISLDHNPIVLIFNLNYWLLYLLYMQFYNTI